MVSKARTHLALDLFSGSGAVSLGLKQAGFSVVGAIDFNPGACKTYRANHPDVMLVEDDITKVSPDVFSSVITGNLDLLVVCAPCQPFSSQNRRRSPTDSRNDLVNAAIPFIERFSPSIVFLENVPGLESSEAFESFRNWLEKDGYHVSKPMRIDAAELGVPQRRVRMILVATKGVSLDRAIDISRLQKKTVKDAIGDLPSPPVGRPSAEDDPLHFARKHSALNILRLQHIPEDGGGRDSLPLHLQLACHRRSKKSSFSDTYGRMRWGDVSPTLTTGCTDITRGRFAHPSEHRSITLREAARLQSFPDSYTFKGNSAQVATQIGNAVPPAMMKAIGASLREALSMPNKPN
ncbi:MULTISPECIES: DNA cytosine methyltransferase [unclassified Pseudomonas]|jgi:DNA (cytosine-5)-methyltransferase 1|uniref:DNA cytosine methyltransferase n=1 Tax=unclassified Pseudomonas TaxID=196821 RepID=UPI000B4FED9E|nr:MULTISPECIES: DNA cytosine methyltransferase [unclassified Pseudomonas]TFA90799.1 DNA (cytosine-5)-methyltransferase 1 [Pseudomonas sp. URIL14HWK12:I1]SNB61555.1 DNA (cytosine-5)-methyltransferase 1 [Pseudomonas sp. LAIL14HWK12:I4]HDS1818080.1 DNA cytosine methyltransferase [Pseudomonas putida]